MGAFSFVGPRIDSLLHKLGIDKRTAFAGRPANAASATGIMDEHKHEVQSIYKQLFHTPHKDLLYKPVKIVHDKLL